MGIANNGTLYAAFLLEYGTIASYRRAASGGWTQLPTIGLPVGGNTPDFFRMDVPSSGPAVIAIAQNKNVTVQRLTSAGTAWSAPETVATNAYALVSELPTTFPAPGQGAPAFPILTGFDVATNSRGDVALGWGTSGAFVNFMGTGPDFGDAASQYSRVLRTAANATWPAATTTNESAYDPALSSFTLSEVLVEMDNDRHAVVSYTSSGATQGQSNPLAVATWNGNSATTWSATQDLSRFCDTSGSIIGPSLSANGTRGVTVGWGCSSSGASSDYAAGLVWARSFS